ncbi:MAG: hypothetical protein HQL32_11890 [Planctomycetes bacterium]|nr:hypothetical protein [Planctomycetota bacterium]
MNQIRKNVLFFKKIGNEAITEAIDNNRTKGIPNSFTRNGKLYWEMPDGTITDKDPNKSA